MSDYGVIPDDELQRIEKEVIVYLRSKRQLDEPACDSLTKIAKHLHMDKDRLLTYLKLSTNVNLIKPARVIMSSSGITVTDDWYVSLHGEDCFGSLAKTALQEAKQRKALMKTIESLSELPDRIKVVVDEIREVGTDVAIIDSKLSNAIKTIDEIYNILKKGGVKRGKRKREE